MTDPKHKYSQTAIDLDDMNIRGRKRITVASQSRGNIYVRCFLTTAKRAAAHKKATMHSAGSVDLNDAILI